MNPTKRMSAEDAQSYTDNVRQWWDRNPFTMGLGSKEENDLTGRVEQVDAKFFQETDRKLRKWWVGATHEEGQRVLAKFVPYALLRGKKVLDIAIGTGWSVVDFAAEGAQVTGIDLTDEAVRLTQRHLALKGLTADVQRMDAQQLAFADGSFDFVLAWGCLMHMPDTERALKQIARVLVPGGGTVAYWYNKSSWTYWFNFIFLRGILCGSSRTGGGSRWRAVLRARRGRCARRGVRSRGIALDAILPPPFLHRQRLIALVDFNGNRDFKSLEMKLFGVLDIESPDSMADRGKLRLRDAFGFFVGVPQIQVVENLAVRVLTFKD